MTLVQPLSKWNEPWTSKKTRFNGFQYLVNKLAPRAIYDAEEGQPKNVGYVQLDGASTDNIYTSDSSNLDIAGNIEVVMRVKVTDWTAAANQTLAGKYVTTSNQRSWRFYVSTTGNIVLTASSDGIAVTNASITPTVALVDNTWYWLRMRLQLTNGANSVGTLDIAADQAEEPTVWTANGSQTAAIIASVFNSTAPLEIGTFGFGTLERMTGQVGRCIVRSGFGGTTVADFNASDCYGDGYWHSGGYRWALGLPKIYDRSANNRAPATFGSGSNQPRWLRWTGTSCVHLESASAGTNSISCTAPSGAASYVARSRDYPNVADDTGAAAAGAFAFTTAGQWQYISILNGSAVEIARFDASLCTQTGMTDSYLVAWTVNRGTAGRKTVVQSPAARSARSVILLGTDDWIDVPAAAIPPMTAADTASATTVYRAFGDQDASYAAVLGMGGYNSASPGMTLRARNTASSRHILYASDGLGTNPVNYGPVLPDLSKRLVSTATIAPTTLQERTNGMAGTPTAITLADRTPSAAVVVGAANGGTSYRADMEFETLILRDAGTTDTEHGLQVAYYGGGL